MTRDDTKKLLARMKSYYPNFSPADLTITVDSWTEILALYKYEDVITALVKFVTTNPSAFAPNLSQLIDLMTPKVTTDEAEAWGMVLEAIRDGIYHSKERFEELPEIVQKAVGSHEVIRAWAMQDTDSRSVTESHFKKAFRTVVQRENDDRKLLNMNNIISLEERRNDIQSLQRLPR